MLDRNKGLGLNSFRAISFCNSCKADLFSASYLSKHFQESFSYFHILYKFDIDEMLDIHRGLGVNPLELFPFVILEKAS